MLEAQTAIVTGGAGSIGAAICRRLCADGAHVVVADVDLSAAERVAQSLERAEAAELDVRQSSQWDDLVGDITARHGRLDILVNNAATHVQALVEDMTDDQWAALMRINCDGVFYGCRAAVRAMKPARRGAIVNIVTGQFGVAYSGAYTSSKFLVHGLSQCLVPEVSRYGIRVNCVAPGAIPATGFERFYREKAELLGIPYDEFLEGARSSVPLKRFGTPEDIANGVAYLASDAASYVTGHLLDVDGGFSGYSFSLDEER